MQVVESLTESTFGGTVCGDRVCMMSQLGAYVFTPITVGRLVRSPIPLVRQVLDGTYLPTRQSHMSDRWLVLNQTVVDLIYKTWHIS